MQFIGIWGISNIGYGCNTIYDDTIHSAHWEQLSLNSIIVWGYQDDNWAEQVRVRIRIYD